MTAAPIAASPTATPAPERHSWLQSIALHLLPGLAPLACMLALAPAMAARGWPLAMGFYLGAFLGVLPVQLVILYYLGWRRNGRLSLLGVLCLRERVPAGRMLLLVLGLFLWATLIFMLLGTQLDGLLRPAFAWMPESLRLLSDDFSGFPLGVGLVTWAAGLVGTAWLAPLVEELYFRGFLLPRMPVAPGWAPLLNAVLFSAYHFWSPWQVLSRILMIAPMNYAVQRNRSLWVSVLTHCVLNTATMIAPLILLLK
jgi:membrane protease YdiL (CAAX protease family)